MASGQPDYTRQVAVTVIDTLDPITVIADVSSPPLNVTFPSTQDVNIASQAANLDVDIASVPANMTTVPSLPFILGRTKKYEDSAFISTDSPATHDVNNDLGRNSHDGYIVNDGPGDLTYAISDNGSTYGDAHTLKSGETVKLTHLDIDSIKITWVADCGYRIAVV
jgi:hypothetical protein